MDANKYSRSIRLICPTCASADFEYDKEIDGGTIRCTSCDRVFSREELVRENGEIVEAKVSEVKKEIVADITKDFRDSMRRAFSGSQHIKFR